MLGVSIGKSKITPLEKATEDYLASFELVYNVADYIAVNVSSPNTPQLRELQQSEQLDITPVGASSAKRDEARLSETQFRCWLNFRLIWNAGDLETIVEVVRALEDRRHHCD